MEVEIRNITIDKNDYDVLYEEDIVLVEVDLEDNVLLVWFDENKEEQFDTYFYFKFDEDKEDLMEYLRNKKSFKSLLMNNTPHFCRRAWDNPYELLDVVKVSELAEMDFSGMSDKDSLLGFNFFAE